MACAVVVAVGDVADKLGCQISGSQRSNHYRQWDGEGVFLGPVIRGSQKERTLKYIEIGENEGAILVRDGRKDARQRQKGYFVGPTIFDHVQSEMKIWQDEIFAPVYPLCVQLHWQKPLSSPTALILLMGLACLHRTAAMYANSARRLMRGCWGLIWAFLLLWLSSRSPAGKIHFMAIFMLTERMALNSIQERKWLPLAGKPIREIK